MEKLKMHSSNVTQANIEKLAELFPNCVTESKADNGELKKTIDFDQLRQELSGTIVEGPQERYHLNWPGKREALLTANAPIAKTLRPCREESVEFDTTRNLFIEGDNLDALKLLQETYLGKVKMIYIDPPYNTGKDFIYEDDFAESTEEYLRKSNQKDDQGNRLIANTDSNGRFHSDWLSMMYPRLKLAKNLLKDDGVIFISIDDGENINIRKLCHEIFGEENFVGNIIWKNVTDNNPTNIATEHEYIVVYAKSKINLEPVWKSKLSDVKDVLINIGNELIENYEDQDALQKKYSKWFRDNKTQLGVLDRYKYIDQGGVYTGSQSVHNPGKEGYRYDVIHPETKLPCKEPLMGYRFPEATMNKLLEKGKILFGNDHNKIIELKVYAKDYLEKLSSVEVLDGRLGAYDVRQLFPEFKKAFTNPKPVVLIEKYLSFILSESDIVLDFFAGSATTAHAVMQLNAEDGGNRKFIMVQLPEVCDEKSEAYKAGYSTIAEIGKERIRRAGKKIKEDNANKEGIDKLDIGFRVLKVDSSNMADVYYAPDAVTQKQLSLMTDNIKPDRTAEDLLFQVLLDWGVDLALPVIREIIADKEVFFVDGNALAACFVKDSGITEDFVKKLAKREPLRVVFRDAGFKDDSVKINVEQIFKLMSSHTDIKTI
ncbi:MAG: site-specific DNA-methyltransferase [Desulfobacterales bacterium]|nr:site-specific DNA-methyltransferase [Desulfobacterales bacterium]MDD4071495.1 site-specific DNA-methyltransferase [Desulfobacterales bacterium]MDD4392936.1 site-specific DNA-methyltransferase [Desulfobacterales bacterium]